MRIETLDNLYQRLHDALPEVDIECCAVSDHTDVLVIPHCFVRFSDGNTLLEMGFYEGMDIEVFTSMALNAWYEQEAGGDTHG